MPVRFVKTSTVSQSCVLPCPLPTTPLSITVPFTATIPGLGSVSGGPKLTLNAGCTDCSVAIDLFAKITPYMLALGLPLCIINCVASLFNVVNDVVSIATGTVSTITGLTEAPPKFPTPSDMTEINKTLKKMTVGDPSANPPEPSDVLKAIQDCKCLIDIFTPYGVCLFIKLIRDILRLVAALLNCLGTLLGDILRITIRADFLRKSPQANLQSQGVCLGSISRSQMNRLSVEMDVVWAVMLAAGTLFKFVEETFELVAPGKYPDAAKFSVIVDKINAFQAKCTGMQSTNLDLVIPDCTLLKQLCFEFRDDLNAVAELLHQIVTVTCP